MRFKTSVLSLVIVAIAVLSLGAAWRMQRPDLASGMFPAVTIEPKAAAAANVLTGISVDLANYASSALLVTVGRAIDSLNNRRYVVLQDDVSGSWTAADSVQIDTVDNASYKLGYKGYNRFIRAVIRASNVGDTSWVAVTVLRAGARFRN